MSATTAVGMNLAAISYWSTEYPFLDRMKSAGAWGGGGVDPASIKLNENGYVQEVPAGSTGFYSMVAMDPVSAGNVNTYVLSWKGTAEFVVPGTRIISREPGKIVFEFTGEGTMQMVAVTSVDPKNPLTSIQLVRSDQADLLAKGEIFNPQFLDKVGVFDTYRFMDWMNVNGSTLKSWSERTTMSDMSWGATTKNASVPIEVMVALSNKTGNNMWLNVPHEADDDYVRQLMTYVRDNLDPSLTVTLEYSNEMWNWGFTQARYGHNMAAQMWGTDANKDGRINPDDNAEAMNGGWVTYYGYRSAQVAAIAQEVFGTAADQRLRNVLSTQVVYQGVEQYIFDGIKRANVGTVDALFEDYAVTTYFGGNLSGYDASDRAIILGWARSGEAGLAAAFKELADGGTLKMEGSLASMVTYYTYQAAVAKKYGMNLVAYEGQLDMAAANFSRAEQPEIQAFFARIQADPRAGALITRMVEDFGKAGGTLLNVLTTATPDALWGTYGTLKSIYDKGSPSYDALVAAQKAAEAAAGLGRDNGRTTANDYVFTATERDVAFAGAGAFTAIGNALDNRITAGDGGSRLFGGAGADTLTGGAGVDYLDGGVGADTMVGKGGDDIYIVDDAGDVVVEAANEGIDEVRTSLASYTLGANVEKLTYAGTGAFTGKGNALDNVIVGGDGGAKLFGDAGRDTLTGGAGADILDGGTGADTMAGKGGDDIYIVDDAGDVVVEAAGEGTDEVRTSLASYTLGANVENLLYTGTGAFAGSGNALDNVITAGDGGSKLSGGAGNDTLVGGKGVDYLVGGEGNDTLRGGAGDDVLDGGAGDDLLDGGTGNDAMTGGAGNDIYIVDSTGDTVVELAKEGIDEVRTSLGTYALTANVENLRYTGTGTFNGTGNALDNVITGGAGDDRLDGGAGNDLLDGGKGNDTMLGGLGDDVFVVDSTGDVVVELAGQGTDTVRTTLSAYTLGANVENLTFTGQGSFAGTGNELANVITAGDGGSKLAGGAGNDTLIGGKGNDWLDGGIGEDRMVGGDGNDTYVVDNIRDVIVETANGGIDEVRTAFNGYTLGAHLENLTFTGTGNFMGLGNSLDNVITGGAGINWLNGGEGNDTLIGGVSNDVLDGGTGADRMIGGDGNDNYLVDDAGDVIVELPGGGIDNVFSSVTYTLGANVEHIRLSGSAAIDATGNELDNQLIGNSAANRLYGGAGNDGLHGQGGDDQLFGGDGDDQLFGNEDNDLLDGGSGNDILYGGTGNDVLIGGAGKDDLWGGEGADRFVFRPGDLSADPNQTDRLFDFTRDEGDKIDLSAFDANGKTKGDDAFTFIGTGDFTKKAGELRVDTSGWMQVVSGDLDGDGIADFTLNVSKNSGTLIATDFIL